MDASQLTKVRDFMLSMAACRAMLPCEHCGNAPSGMYGSQGAQGIQGARGAQGAQGATGPQGSMGFIGCDTPANLFATGFRELWYNATTGEFKFEAIQD